jgi:hypothetical protein
MEALVRYGLLSLERTVLAYGCGQCEDVRTLRVAGLAAVGWDLHDTPMRHSPRPTASISATF